MLEILKGIILGVIEGITEWLPISSTGHLVIAEQFLSLDSNQEFVTMFDVVIQLGAILAVVVLYFHKLNPFAKTKTKAQRDATWRLWFQVAVASVPAAVLGLLFDNKIDAVMEKPVVICFALILFGALFIVVENRQAGKKPEITKLSQIHYRLAAGIGLLQVVAMFLPGTSRSGITIVGGLLLGMARPVIAEFTFFLGIPVMFGASFLKLVKFGLHYSVLEFFVLLTGFLVAFLVSAVTIRFLMCYIKKHNFKAFGYYRIVFGGLALLYFLLT